MSAITSPLPQFFDTDGSPLNNGELYFGTANQNPQTNPITVYWDSALTQPAAQPIKTKNGYPMRSGTPAVVYVSGDYSLMVLNSRGAQVVYARKSSDITSSLADQTSASNGAGMVGFNVLLSYAAGTVGAFLQTLSGWATSVATLTNKTILAAGPNTVEATSGPNTTQLSHRNLVINGHFQVNQRSYVSGAATGSANQYTFDRWRVVTSGQSITYASSGCGNVATAPAGGIEQVVEGASIDGGTYTLSWTGTATATVNGSAVTNGGQVTLTGGSNATIKFVSGTVDYVQLEKGSKATPFELRSIQTETTLCERYYQLINPSIRFNAAAISTEVNSPVGFQRMRSSPTATLLAAGTRLNVSSVGIVVISANSARMFLVNGGTGDAYAFNEAYSLSAEL